jgi:hypothetical protein
MAAEGDEMKTARLLEALKAPRHVRIVGPFPSRGCDQRPSFWFDFPSNLTLGVAPPLSRFVRQGGAFEFDGVSRHDSRLNVDRVLDRVA